ncbi:MAG TPA: hypothetical protein VI789_03315 [Dehalococcoidia bacterium]|nr:hypothetical protein [Dehalococcoidia bacterium]
MEIVLQWHRIEAYAAVLWMLLCGLWGVARHWRGQRDVSQSYGRALWLAGALPVLQALLGVVLLLRGSRADVLHVLLYGTLAPFVLPVVYLYTQRRGREHTDLALGLGCLFQVAFLLRAISKA